MEVMMKKLMCLLFILTAGAVYANPGVSGAFTDVGTARPSALGGAFTAVADDSNAVFYNPAGIVLSDYKDFSFLHFRQKGIIPYNYASFIFPISRMRGLGAGMIISGDEIFDEKTFFLSYAENFGWVNRMLSGFSLGANVKFMFAGYGDQNISGGEERIKGSAWGIGLDLSSMWQVNENIRAGVMIRDSFSWISWKNQYETYTEGVPLTSSFGVSYRMPEFMISGEIADLGIVKIGIEKTFFKHFDLRGGYTQVLDPESYKEYFVGFGLSRFVFGPERSMSASLDFSYGFERLDNTFKIQAGFRFK
jgi:long-subunit fatty acid transport protein